MRRRDGDHHIVQGRHHRDAFNKGATPAGDAITGTGHNQAQLSPSLNLYTIPAAATRTRSGQNRDRYRTPDQEGQMGDTLPTPASMRRPRDSLPESRQGRRHNDTPAPPTATTHRFTEGKAGCKDGWASQIWAPKPRSGRPYRGSLQHRRSTTIHAREEARQHNRGAGRVQPDPAEPYQPIGGQPAAREAPPRPSRSHDRRRPQPRLGRFAG